MQATVLESEVSGFPAALRKAGYNRLWAIGEIGILDRPLLGLFCSRRCPGEVILLAYDIARGLRDANIAVVSGFHSPMEKECSELLLRGRQPVVVCPARGIQNMRIPTAWRNPITQGRLLIVSPFDPRHRRVGASLATERNQFACALADLVLVLHAAQNSRLERLCLALATSGRTVLAPDVPSNASLDLLGVRLLASTAIGETMISELQRSAAGKVREE